ncbi:MAG: serine/threonine-protein kinase, partial [Polyangiaceae bacterium]
MPPDSKPSTPPGPSAASLPVEPGSVLDGKYQVLRVLGSGGMGVVLAATHKLLGHQVAIKLMRPDAARDEQAVARFLREARAAIALSSEHVARTLD